MRQFLRNGRADLRWAAKLAPNLFVMHLRARRRTNLLWGLWLFLPIVVALLVSVSLQKQKLIPQTDVPFAAFVTIGVAAWQTFAEALMMPLRWLASHRALIVRTRMPMEAAILAGLLEIGSGVALRLLCIAAALPLLHASPGVSVVGIPLVLMGLAAIGLAIGLMVSPLGLLVEDAHRATMILLGLLVMLTPVAYPLDDSITRWNAIAVLIEGMRAGLTGTQISKAAILISTLSLLALLPAWIWFRLSRSSLIERVA
ncbi:ABC transporter permease [Sphingomonas daechungensis]|uniref:ABC transporter permease n=1 Tax=Sphingomonas daechungensis TaxID=1176646 RepID=UPI00378527BE